MTTHHSVPQGVEEENHNANRAAKGISYFTPLQDPPAGTAFIPQPDNKSIPKVFTPLQIRGMKMQNRIMLSPLCQYSSQDGHHTAWHAAHLGGIISRGPGISFIEATSVTAEGRITPEDAGIWKDSQIAPFKAEVEFAHSQGQHIGIQLAHAGRKASTVAPWLSDGDIATPELNGWPDNVYAPSAIAFNERHATPKAMTLDDIESFKKAFKDAIDRSIKAGFDTIEIHSAHGYLLHSFLSPVTNKRTDRYGGSFENRVRLLLEVAELSRASIPESMPLFVRVSATDWLEEVEGFGPENSWKSEDTVRLAPLLAERGVDVLDVSSGGNHPSQKIRGGPSYQAPFAQDVKKVVGDKMIVGTVGTITSGKQAEELLERGLDITTVGRAFQKNPGLVFSWADELDCDVNMPNQIRWGFGGRGKKRRHAATEKL